MGNEIPDTDVTSVVPFGDLSDVKQKSKKTSSREVKVTNDAEQLAFLVD